MQQSLQFAQPLAQPPIEVQQLAEAHHLGTLVAIYPKKKLGFGVQMILFIIALFFVGSPVFAQWQFFSQGIASYSLLVLLLFLGFNLIWYGVLIIVFTVVFRNRKHQGYIYIEGFLCYGGSKTIIVRWEEIESVWRGTENDGSIALNTLKIQKTDGKTINVGGHISNAVQFCENLEQEYVARKLPGTIERYNAGALIAFGKLMVSQQGLSKGNSFLPWDVVEIARVSDKHISIKKLGKRIGWFHGIVPNVPDACLLRALLQYVRPG